MHHHAELLFRQKVLASLHAAHNSLDEIKGRLTRQETLMQTLTGDGQPGRIAILEKRVSWLLARVWIALGVGAAIAFLGWKGIQVLFSGRP